jgi:hypothetical protein
MPINSPYTTPRLRLDPPPKCLIIGDRLAEIGEFITGREGDRLGDRRRGRELRHGVMRGVIGRCMGDVGAWDICGGGNGLGHSAGLSGLCVFTLLSIFFLYRNI